VEVCPITHDYWGTEPIVGNRAAEVERRRHVAASGRPDSVRVRPVIMTGASGHLKIYLVKG
jgi:hypothetical protein